MYHQIWDKQRRPGKYAAQGLTLAAALSTLQCADDSLHWRIAFDHRSSDKRVVRLYYPQAIIRALHSASNTTRGTTNWATGKHTELFAFDISVGRLWIKLDWNVNVVSTPLRMSVRYTHKGTGDSQYASIYLLANDDPLDKQILEDTVGSLVLFAFTGEDDAESVVNSLIYAKNTRAFKLDTFTSLELRRNVERWNLFITRIAQQRYLVPQGRLVLTLTKMMDWLSSIEAKQRELLAHNSCFFQK